MLSTSRRITTLVKPNTRVLGRIAPQQSSGLQLRWVVTADGLRMRWSTSDLG